MVGKKGAKLHESSDDAEKPSCKIQPPQERTDGLLLRSFICKKTGIDRLAALLPTIAPAYVDLPVVDLTELKGIYPAPGGVGEVPTTSDPDGLTVFDAL